MNECQSLVLLRRSTEAPPVAAPEPVNLCNLISVHVPLLHLCHLLYARRREVNHHHGNEYAPRVRKRDTRGDRLRGGTLGAARHLVERLGCAGVENLADAPPAGKQLGDKVHHRHPRPLAEERGEHHPLCRCLHQRLTDERRPEEVPERHHERPAADAAEVESRVWPGSHGNQTPEPVRLHKPDHPHLPLVDILLHRVHGAPILRLQLEELVVLLPSLGGEERYPVRRNLTRGGAPAPQHARRQHREPHVHPRGFHGGAIALEQVLALHGEPDVLPRVEPDAAARLCTPAHLQDVREEEEEAAVHAGAKPDGRQHAQADPPHEELEVVPYLHNRGGPRSGKAGEVGVHERGDDERVEEHPVVDEPVEGSSAPVEADLGEEHEDLDGLADDRDGLALTHELDFKLSLCVARARRRRRIVQRRVNRHPSGVLSNGPKRVGEYPEDPDRPKR
mmetsp:Transcript_13330/g.58018  ORF Transcript_13330/g.58018 Transcript_13330/m.58018 type:complete len:449 (+) Transcript_13330:1085-2431(+)